MDATSNPARGTEPTATVREIADALTGAWTVRVPESRHWPHHIERADGADLWVEFGTNRNAGRIIIEGRMTRELLNFKSYDASLPDITMSANKSPADIAREIERRLLPRLEPILSAAKASKQASDESDARRAAMKASILAALGDAGRERTNHAGDSINLRVHDHMYGDIEVRHGEARVELHISDAETAKRLAAWLAAEYDS
jgi:hypothetical protein